MTEAEWLSCADPQPMLEYVRGKVSQRKLTLFAVACCRRVWALIKDDRSRHAVDVAEHHAEGRASRLELEQAVSQARAAIPEGPRGAITLGTRAWRDAVVAGNVARAAWATVYNAGFADLVARWTQDVAEQRGLAWNVHAGHWQSDLLRDVVGNPFRPVGVQATWLTPTVVELAQAAYDERAFHLLPVLADALEEVGCDDRHVLEHCRRQGPHVRGCLVVDALTGRG